MVDVTFVQKLASCAFFAIAFFTFPEENPLLRFFFFESAEGVIVLF